jgi:hypothetical protein
MNMILNNLYVNKKEDIVNFSTSIKFFIIISLLENVLTNDLIN